MSALLARVAARLVGPMPTEADLIVALEEGLAWWDDLLDVLPDDEQVAA